MAWYCSLHSNLFLRYLVGLRSGHGPPEFFHVILSQPCFCIWSSLCTTGHCHAETCLGSLSNFANFVKIMEDPHMGVMDSSLQIFGHKATLT